MTKQEFVKLHGETAWEDLVKPLQENGAAEQRANANALVHGDLSGVLRILGLTMCPGLTLAAKKIRQLKVIAETPR